MLLYYITEYAMVLYRPLKSALEQTMANEAASRISSQLVVV